MAKLTITAGNPRLDGEYEIDLSGGFNFTKNEWFMIHKRVGVTIENFRSGAPIDMNTITALGLIMLQRAGKEELFDAFMETNDAQTSWEWETAEAGEEDAATSPLTQQTSNGFDADENSRSDGSGPSTNELSDISPGVILGATGGLT